VRAEIISGRAGGSWRGTGLTSSVAAAVDGDPNQPYKTGVGYATASSLGIVGSGTVDQQHVDDTTVVIAYTLLGDSNMDGSVDSNDFALLAANYGKTGQQWLDGDYNYDGTVNALDFNALATNYGAAPINGAIADSAPLGAVVPEPATIGLLLVGGFMFAAQRRNRKNFRHR
jgi:hypothetical protein